MTEHKTLYAAMATALPLVEGATKDKNNPAFKSKYADLGAVIEAIRPVAEHGLWFRQVNHLAADGVCIETFIFHTSGEEISTGQVFVPASKKDAQGYGSAQTYCRRYSLMAAFGIAPEDDDGNAAVKSPPQQVQQSRIDADQLQELQELLDVSRADAAAMCKFYAIASLRDLPAGKFEHARKALIAKLPQKEVAE